MEKLLWDSSLVVFFCLFAIPQFPTGPEVIYYVRTRGHRCEFPAGNVSSALSLLAPKHLYSGSRNQRSAWPVLTQNGDREESDEPRLQMDWNERLTFPPSGLCFQSIPERKCCLPKEATQGTQRSLEGTFWRGNGRAKVCRSEEATEPEKLGRVERRGCVEGRTLLALSSYLNLQGSDISKESFRGCGPLVPVSLGLPHF